MKISYILLGLGALVGGSFLFKSKIDNWSEIMPKLKAFPTGIRNFDITGGKLVFNVDVALFNPTLQNFNPDGVVATLKRIIVKTVTNIPILSVEINKSHLSIPAGKKVILKDLRVEIGIAQTLLNFQSLSQIKSISDIKTDAIVSVLGQEYTISN